MKKLIIGLLLLLSISVKSQSIDIDLPRYYIVQEDTIGIIISIEQAQKIDNDIEISSLLNLSMVQCDSLQSKYIIVVDKLNNRVALLQFKIDDLNMINSDQNKMINNLKLQIESYNKELKLCDDQSKDKDKIIDNQKHDIRKLKRQRIGGYIISTILSVSLAYVAIISK